MKNDEIRMGATYGRREGTKILPVVVKEYKPLRPQPWRVAWAGSADVGEWMQAKDLLPWEKIDRRKEAVRRVYRRARRRRAALQKECASLGVLAMAEDLEVQLYALSQEPHTERAWSCLVRRKAWAGMQKEVRIMEGVLRQYKSVKAEITSTYNKKESGG